MPFEAHSIRVELHQQGGLVGRWVVTKRPGDNRTTNVRARGIAQVLRHEHPAAPFEQGAFFFREVRRILEVAQVGFPQMGQHAFGGMDALCEPRHFARLADASFDERQVVVVVQGPNAQGDPELAVVAHGASMHPHRLRQESHDPFFHGGFAVAPSDGKHGAVEAVALRPCHALHDKQYVVGDKDVRIGRPRGVGMDRLADHKTTHAPAVGLEKVVVTVVPWAPKGEKHGAFRLVKGARVGRQGRDGPAVRTSERALQGWDALPSKITPCVNGPTLSGH